MFCSDLVLKIHTRDIESSSYERLSYGCSARLVIVTMMLCCVAARRES